MLTKAGKHPIVNKVWGSEEHLINVDLPNASYCGKILKLDYGAISSLHYHCKKHETFWVLDGIVLFFYKGNDHPELMAYTLEPGDSFVIEPGHAHRFGAASREGATIIEFSTFHDDDDVVRIHESRRVAFDEVQPVNPE